MGTNPAQLDPRTEVPTPRTAARLLFGGLGAAVAVGVVALMVATLPTPPIPAGIASPTDPGPSGSPIATELPSGLATPWPTLTLEPASITPYPAQSTVPTLVERETSNRFWAEHIQFEPPMMLDFDFGSLADMTETTDLVVRGRIARVYVGEYWVFSDGEEGAPFAYATVVIDEVLKGLPVSREPGSIEVQLSFPGVDWDPTATGLPVHEHLFFLIHEASDRLARGAEPRDSEIAPFAYFLPTPQAIFRDIEDRVALIAPETFAAVWGDDHFPLQLEGSDYNVVLERVEQLAAEQP